MAQRRIHLPDIDQYLEDGRLTAPSNSESIKFDGPAFFKYLTEKYGGDIDKMSQEEKDRFIIKNKDAQVA